MKAIGAKNTAILTIFLVESGLLGLLGGLIGLLSGMALAKSVEVIGTLVLGTNLLKALFPWWLVVGSLAFAFILGVLSGILPARQASKQQAVDSLRYE
jgi:putative ABC transport system permease protein